MSLLIMLSVQITLTSVYLVSIFAEREAQALRNSQRPTVEVQYRSLSSSAEQKTESNLELIEATGLAAFFYDARDKRTIVIPKSQIVSIEVPE